MTLAEPFAFILRAALDDLAEHTASALNGPDTSATKAALNRAWFAIHTAQQALIDGENETRRQALAKLENAA